MKSKAQRRKYHKLDTLLRIIIILIIVMVGIIVYRTYESDLKAGTSGVSVFVNKNKQEADTSGDWNLILVNRSHYIPDNYSVNLTELSNGKKVDTRIYPELQQMFDNARADGLALFVREGYRTAKEQQQIMSDKVNEYINQGLTKSKAKEMAKKYVAAPGTSEHQLGISVDINADTTKCTSDKVYEWLDKNAYKYGFIKRYPTDKTDITGINNEQWHYRYVGKTVAQIMKEENLCLEEYITKYK